ncbi:MAG: 1-deoxy-D-xylulose-5-phosphate reductoisomerase [Calditrichaeota bacterium]|nr:1-deoxy-D-xylulose-5-phosphate reductoisomerase [Calditrichota bacterium]MCB9368196.1 1-deoxy-D-xylulose-5-phosphate reductoisomerase [Calditrichota bacterium]
MKDILLQGSTGSIGISALSVISEQKDRFRVVGLSAGHKEQLLLEQASLLKPASVALLRPSDPKAFTLKAKSIGIKEVFTGQDAFRHQAEQAMYDVMLNAVMGSAGVRPTISSLERGKNVALANKETLVAAGEIVMKCAREHDAAILPIDSEHSALQQCLVGESAPSVRKYWLTTSGGPFWGRSQESLVSITSKDALAHPTWAMGPKITIDSATLFNKGLEVIEACRLFDVSVDFVDVVRQRESVVHSMIEFSDGSFKAQLSVPDMRLPILYALTYPDRVESHLVESHPASFGALHFEAVDRQLYPCLELAFAAIRTGGTAPAILSAADEIAVQAFLAERIEFTDIPRVIRRTLESITIDSATDVDVVMSADEEARRAANEFIQSGEFARVQVSC